MKPKEVVGGTKHKLSRWHLDKKSGHYTLARIFIRTKTFAKPSDKYKRGQRECVGEVLRSGRVLSSSHGQAHGCIIRGSHGHLHKTLRSRILQRSRQEIHESIVGKLARMDVGIARRNLRLSLHTEGGSAVRVRTRIPRRCMVESLLMELST